MQPKTFKQKFALVLTVYLGLLLLLYLLPAPELAKEEPKRYDKPAEAQEFYVLQRAPMGETAIPVEKYAIALQQMERMPQYSTAENRFLPAGQEMRTTGGEAIASWESLGPGNVGGRTRALLIHPTITNTMYAAGVSGGIWKSTDAGASWLPLDDMMANLAVTSMAMEPQNPLTIYAGTGEGFFNVDAVRGDGIFQTTNGGTTWTQLASTANNPNFHYVNDIVVSPNIRQRLYAATRTGVWRSEDGGTSWRQLLNPALSGGCLDLVVRTDQNPDWLLASCGIRGITELVVSDSVVYRSIDDGSTWSPVLTEAGMGRTSLAIAPSDQETMYALAASNIVGPDATGDGVGDYRDGLLAVFRSTDGGATWNAQVRNTDTTPLNTLLLTNTPLAVACFEKNAELVNLGWYANVIAVDPVLSTTVWAGGIDLFRSDDGGQNWGLASHWWAKAPYCPTTQPQYAHADQHTIVFHPNYNGISNTQMFVGNDGGLFRTDNALAVTTTEPCSPTSSSVHWSSLNNGYGVTQFYHGLPYPDGSSYFGGSQDNGTIQGTDSGSPNAWQEILGGDGGYVAVDPTNTNVLFAETTGLSIEKSTDGGHSFSPAISGITESPNNFLFIAPFIMDPSNPQTLWTGGKRLWRTDNQATSWSQASTALSGVSSGKVSALGVAPTDSNVVVAGMSDGFIFGTQSGISSNSSTVWSNSQPTSGYVSWLAFDPRDKKTVYATYSTFGVDHVWKSSDAGSTWTAIDQRGQSNGIPDIPAHTIVVDPNDSNRLFVGTDLGLFVTTNGGANWVVENSGFANVVTEAMSTINGGGTDILYAFTHGRGAYRVPISSPMPTVTGTPPTATPTTTPTPTVTGTPPTATPTSTPAPTGLCTIPRRLYNLYLPLAMHESG